MTRTLLPSGLVALLLATVACDRNPYDTYSPPTDDDTSDDDDSHPGDDDDTGPGDDDTHPGDDDDTGPQQDFAGSCASQPTQPSPTPIAEPEFRTSFGSNGGIRGSHQLLDADGDGDLDVISAENLQVSAHDLDGTLLWQGPVATRSWAGTVLANVDGQPGDEVVAADGAGAIHVWAADGPPLAGFPVQIDGHGELRSLAAADLDGDGADEIVVMTAVTPLAAPATMHVYEGDGTPAVGWPHYVEGDPATHLACPDCGGFNQNVAIGDLDDDGVLDLVFAQNTSSISVFDAGGATRDVHGSFDNCGEGNTLHWGEVQSMVPFDQETAVTCSNATEVIEFTYSPPLIADLEHDGNAEIIAIGNLEDPSNPGPITGSALVVYEPGRQHRPGFVPYPLSGPSIYADQGDWHTVSPSVVAANFQGNPELELLAVHLDGTARLYDAGGAELWSWTWATDADCLLTEPLIADLDGDRVPEAIVVSACPDTAASTLTVLGGEGDVRLTYALDFPSIAAPLLADVDGDHQPELLLVNDDGYHTVRIYDWPGVDDACLIWPQGRGDPAHTAWLH
jgi:hypothetical protein